MAVLRLFAMHIAVCAATTTAAEPEPSAYITTAGPEPAPAPAAGTTTSGPPGSTTTAQQTQTIVHKVTMTSLAEFTDAAALMLSYKNSMANATGVNNSAITVAISKITLTITISLTGVTANQLAEVRQGIANHAGVDVSAVELVVSSRRLLSQSQDSADERRLTTTNWVASITVNNTGDYVTKAKDIHATMQDAAQVATTIAAATGGTVTAQVSVSFEVTMSTVIATSAVLDIAAIDAQVGQGLNGTAVTTSYSGATTTTAASGGSGGGSGGAGGSTGKGSDDAPRSSGYILVAFLSVLLAIKAI
jgi:hypothetical protein